MVAAALTGLCLSCAAVSVRGGSDLPPVAPLHPRLASATVWTLSAAAPDTLILQARWNLPGSDGRGELDSVTVNFTNLTADGWLRVNVPLTSVAATLRQPIPYGEATYILRAQVCSYRRRQVACADQAVEYVYREPPLAAVTGLTVTPSRVP